MKIRVVDAGVGNLFSVVKALEKCGSYDVKVTSSVGELESADKVILPGVGAFGLGIQGLRDRGLEKVIHEKWASGTPILGICLGMQFLASQSLEFGSHKGLALIDGVVSPMPTLSSLGDRLKVPFVGWADLKVQSRHPRSSLLSHCESQFVYLVHSYHFVPKDPDDILAHYEYGGVDIVAAVARENVIGLQFHPEKSGDYGLEIIKEFLNA